MLYRLLNPSPWYLKTTFGELNEMLSPHKVEIYYNYDQFVKTRTSLMVTMLLIDNFYEDSYDTYLLIFLSSIWQEPLYLTKTPPSWRVVR